MSAYDRLQEGITKHVSLKEISRLYVRYVYEALGENKLHTAKKIGIDRRTIQRWFQAEEDPS